MTESSASRKSEITCPACGGANSSEAVFCGNPECHKALGEFRYVLEEIEAASSASERIADKVSDFVGRPHFVTIHIVWFTIWILLNSGLLIAMVSFDAYPFNLLALILSIEAILMTSFLLISSNRQSVHAQKRAELDYEVNVRAFRKILEIESRLRALEQALTKK